MSFLELLMGNAFLVFFMGIGIFYVIHILIDKKIRLTKRLLLSYPLYIGVYSLVSALVFYPALQHGYGTGGSEFITLVETSMIVLYCIYLFGIRSIKKILTSVMIALALNAVCLHILFNIAIQILPETNDRVVLSVLPTVFFGGG